jgi:membrane-bound lytic murein transglycosylase D
LLKWISALAVLLISFPMWARFVGNADGDPFTSTHENSAEEDDAADKMPEPTPEKPAVIPLKPLVLEKPATPSAPVPVAPTNTVTSEFGGVWHSPDYSKQEKSLGYAPDAFAVPAGLQERVQFWENVYTKYTNDQGLLHDSQYVSLIYETIELADISNNPALSARQKDKEKEKRIKNAKKLVAERLKNLASVKDQTTLSGEDLRYWKLFEKIDEPNKFNEAARKGRLRYQAGQRDQFMRGITSSGRYLRQMEEIFRAEGLPIELTRLPFVESSFNLGARSKVGASGIWQFMRTTGRQYMRLNEACDERNDPLHATRAAARKFRQDFEMLESWPLTITGWNHGSAGVRRLVEKAHTKDIAELTDVRRGRFRFASANFFASFLAALEVEKNAVKHFGMLPVLPEVKGEEIKLVKELTIAQLLKWFKGEESLARLYNPHIKSNVWTHAGRLRAKDFVRVPIELASQANADLGRAPSSVTRED